MSAAVWFGQYLIDVSQNMNDRKLPTTCIVHTMVSSYHRMVINSWNQLADTEKHVKATRTTHVTLKLLSIVSKQYTTHTIVGRVFSVQFMAGNSGLHSPTRSSQG